MQYFVLQINVDTGSPILHKTDGNGVDPIVGLHESCFSDFPVIDGVRHLEDNQSIYFVADKDNAYMLFNYAYGKIQDCEAYFDNLKDPANPDDETTYARMGGVMQEWINVSQELPSIQ